MTASDSGHVRYRVLILSWHPPFEVITAGGHRRTFEILKRTPADFQVEVLDNKPSFLSGLDRPNVHVVEYGMPETVKRLERKHFNLERSLELLLASIYFVWMSLRFRAEGRRFDVVYVPGSEVFSILLAGFLVAGILHCDLVAANFNIELFPRWLRAPIARMHNAAAAVVTLSDDLEVALNGYGLRAPTVINGVGLDTRYIASVEPPSPVEEEYDAIFVGRHVLSKGVIDLIEIWGSVTGRLPAARLVMAGYCYPDRLVELQSLIAERGLGDRIRIMGPVGEDEKIRLLKSAKVCLFPSYIEGWGLVPAEALACGLPAVVYDLPVYRENVRPCEAVFAVPTGDCRAMAEKTIELLSGNSFELYREVGPRFVERFDWGAVASDEFGVLRRYSTAQRTPRPVPGGGARLTAERAVKKMVDSPPAPVRRAFKNAAIAYFRFFRSGRTFRFNGRDYHYFYHPYNLAWRNERTVEIPIAGEFLSAHAGQEVLEVGNVLSHYMEVRHDIIDKYEIAEGVTNEDAVDFDPGKRYDLILSISTLEHVGWDETPRDPGKLPATVRNLMGLLAPGGKLVATVPLGLNPEFDRLVGEGAIPFTEMRALRRIGRKNEWIEADVPSVIGSRYARHAFRADAIIVGLIREGQVKNAGDSDSE